MAGHHNLLPSLHVALSAITFLAVAPGRGRAGQRLLGLWFAARVGSTLLTHQHQVADVAAGLVLAWAIAARVR